MTDRFNSADSLANWIMPCPAFEVDWDRAALILIYCQNYAASSDCGLIPMLVERYSDVAEYYVPRIRHSISNAQWLLKAFRNVQRDVIFTRHGPLLPSGHDMIARRQQRDSAAREQSDRPTLWPKGSTEHQIVDELALLDDELVLDKNSSSPLTGTGIDQLLRNLKVETLVVVGMATDMCVETTARDAADRGYNVIVFEDAVATFCEEHHDAALAAMARVYTQVWTTSSVLRLLKSVRCS